MYLKQQYLDYELYKSNRLSDLYFNNAKELDDNFENVEQTYGDIAILYHQALLINKNNIDAGDSLTKMIDDGKITAEQSTELRKVAFSKLKNRNKEVANLNIDDSDINPDLIDFTPPIFKFAKVTTDLKKIVQVEFDEPIKENSNISPNDFQLFINNNYTLISSITVDSSGILLLHLSSDVREGKTLNLKYIRDLNNTNNNVTDRNNNVLVSFGPVQVINLVDTTPPYFINGKVTNDNPNIIELTFTETMNNNLTFNKNTFTVNIGGYEVDIKDVNINDKKINITLFNNIISTQTILVSYQKTNNIFENLTDLVGNELFSFINQELENEVVPLYKSGVVNDDFPNKIFIDFDGSILNTTQFNLNDFSVSVEGINVDISSITVNIERNLTIELKNNIKTNETIILSYTKSNISSNNIVDENNNPVDTFIDKIIENLIAPIFDNGFVSNEVNNIITINFNGVIKEISQDIDLTTTPDFTVKIGGQSKMIKEILVQNGNVTISTHEYISSMQSISIIYLKNKGRPEKNLVNEQDIPIRSFTANIENRVAPVLIKKTVENDTSNNITLEFDVDVTCSNIKPENFQTNIKGYKYTDFPIVEYSTHSQSILNIIDAQIVNGDVVLDFDGMIAAGAEGYVQYIDPGNNSDEKITDLCGNRLRTNSLIYPPYHPTEPYNWITNKVEPQLIGAEIVQYVTNETNNQEYYQGILLKFNPHIMENLSNAVSYEIFVNNANTSSGIDDNIFFETTNQRFTNSPQKTLLVIMKDEYNITDTLSLKYYQNNNNYIEYTNYQKFIDYREYNMSEYNTNIDKLIVKAIGDIPIINKLPPLFSSGEATNADFKRIILKFNSTLANKTISSGNFLVKINDISQNIAEVGVFDNSNVLYIKMSNQIPDESTIQVIYTRDTINSFNNIQGIYQNDVAGFDTETNIINTIDSTPPEILSLTTTSSNTISLQLNEPLIENNINDDILNIHIDEVLVDISSVVIDTSNIQIVIHENITSMQNLTLTYDATQKDGPYVSDILGNVLHYPNPTPITNTIPPVYTSSTTIYNGYLSNNKTIQLSFDVDISQNTDTDLCGNDFDLTIDGVSQDINSISIVNGKVQITTIDNIVSMQDISFKYTQSDISASHLKDQNGNSVISFTARKTIQNTIPPFFNTLYPPRITNVEPFKIRIPFNVPLTNNIYNNNLLPSSFSLQLYTQPILLPVINSVEISDGDVILNYTTTNSGKPKINDLFVLSYTKPSNSLNQIKDDNGNSIENFGRNSFSSTPTQPILVEIEPELQSLKVTDNESSKIQLLFSPAFASNNISDLCGNDFNITIDDVTPDISNIQLFHNTLIFELKQSIISNQVVQLQYIKPANQLNQFTFNNSVYSDKVFYFESHESVLSITNLVKPVFQSSIVRNDFFNKENEIFLTYNVDLNDNANTLDKYQFDIYDSRYTDENDHFHIDDIEIINNQIKIVLSRNINNRHYIKEGATIVLKYEPDLNPNNNYKNIIDKNGNSAIGFGNDGIIIDNRVLTRPTFSSVLATNGYDSSRLSDRLPENQITFTLNTPRDLSNNDICGNLINIFRRMVEIVTTTTTEVPTGQYGLRSEPWLSGASACENLANQSGSRYFSHIGNDAFSNGYNMPPGCLGPKTSDNFWSYNHNHNSTVSCNSHHQVGCYGPLTTTVTNTTTTFEDETEKVLQTVSTNIVNNGETTDVTLTLDASLNWYQHLKYNYFNDSNFTKNIIDVSNIMVESFETGEYETDNIVINIHPTIGVSGEFNTDNKTFIVSSIDTEQKRIAFYDKNDPNSTFNQRIEYFQQTYEKEAYVDGLPRRKKFKIHPYPIDINTPDYSGAFIEPDQKNIIVLQFHEEIEPNADISKNTFVIDMSGRINNTIDLEHRPNIDISSLTIDSSGQIIIELMDDARYLEQFSITYTKAGAGDPSILYDAQGNEAENFTNEMVDVSRLPNDDPPQFYDFGFGTNMVDMYMPDASTNNITAMTTGDFSFTYYSSMYLNFSPYYFAVQGLRAEWKIDIHPPRNNYNNLEIIIVDEIDTSVMKPNKFLKIYGKDPTNPNIWDFGTPHDSINTGVNIVNTNTSYNKSKLNRIGIDICNNIFVATNNKLNIYYYQGVNGNSGTHSWDDNNNFSTLEFDFNITILIVSGRDLILGFDYTNGLYYYTMNENNTWPSSKSSYKDIIAQDLYMYNHDPNAVRTVEVYKDTMVMGSFQSGWWSSSRASELDNPNFPYTTVRFYIKNNNNFFDNNYTTYTLSTNYNSAINFKLDQDVFVWIPAVWDGSTENFQTEKIGIMKKNKRNEWPSVINLSNNKNYFLESCNDEYHREVYVYNNLIYVVKGDRQNYNLGFREQKISKIYKIITDETGQITIEKDSNGSCIDYNPYPNDSIHLTIAGSGSSGQGTYGKYDWSINNNFVGNYFFYLHQTDTLFTQYKMIDMQKYSTDKIINTQKIEIEFTKDLSLNDLCGNDFIINDLTGQNTITNLELKNDKFIEFTLEDKINTTEYIEIEYNPNIDPTFAIAEKLYNKPLTYFKYDSIIPFITNQVINRDNSNNIVITFNEKIDYEISPTFVNISFTYTDSYHNPLSAVPHTKDISKNIITLTPSSLPLTNDYKYIITYTQGTDQNYNLKDTSNNVSNFNVVFDFLPPEFTRIISYSPFYNVNSIDTTGNSAKIYLSEFQQDGSKYRHVNNYYITTGYSAPRNYPIRVVINFFNYSGGSTNTQINSLWYGNNATITQIGYNGGTNNGLFYVPSYSALTYGAFTDYTQRKWARGLVHRLLLLTDDWMIFPNDLTEIRVYEYPKDVTQLNFTIESAITTLQVNHIPGSGYELYNYSWSSSRWVDSEKPYVYLYDYNKKQKHFMAMFKALAKGSQWSSSSNPPTNANARITNECHIFQFDSLNNAWSKYDKVLRPSVSDQNGQILVNGYDSLQYCSNVPLSTDHNVIVTQFQGSQDGQWLQHALVYIYDENSGEWGLPHSHIDISGIVRIENYKLTYSGLMTNFLTSDPSWTYESNISLGNNRPYFSDVNNQKAQIHIQKNEILILELNKNNVEYNGIYVYNLNSDGSYGTREVIENISTEESTNHPTMYSEHYKITTSDMVNNPNVDNCIHAMAMTETTLFALNVNTNTNKTNLYVYYRSHIYGKLDNNNNIIEHVKIGDMGLHSNSNFTYYGLLADQMFCTDTDLIIWGYRWILNTFDYTDEDRENTIFCNISKDISQNDIDKNNFIVEDLSGDVYVTDIVPKEQAIVIETEKNLDLNNIFIKYSKQGGTVENQQNVNIVDTTGSYFMEDNEMLFGNWTPNNQTT